MKTKRSADCYVGRRRGRRCRVKLKVESETSRSSFTPFGSWCNMLQMQKLRSKYERETCNQGGSNQSGSNQGSEDLNWQFTHLESVQLDQLAKSNLLYVSFKSWLCTFLSSRKCIEFCDIFETKETCQFKEIWRWGRKKLIFQQNHSGLLQHLLVFSSISSNHHQIH